MSLSFYTWDHLWIRDSKECAVHELCKGTMYLDRYMERFMGAYKEPMRSQSLHSQFEISQSGASLSTPIRNNHSD